MSLFGRLLNAAPPLPLGTSTGFYRIPTYPLGGANDELLLRTYSMQGTVFANVSLLASSAAKPEWRLYRKNKTDGRVRYTTSDQGSDERQEVVQHQALKVLNQPAVIRSASGQNVSIWTRFGLFEISGIYMELTGRSFWVVETAGGSSIPVGLWPVRPDRMTPVPDEKQYLKGWVYEGPNGEKVPLDPQDVIFNRYPDPQDPYGGQGPAGSVLTDVEAARYAAEWNRNFFLNSAEPGGVIQVDKALSDEEFDQLSDRWREAHRGVSRAHRVAVLEGGAVWVQNQHSLRDMDFTNLRGTSRDIIREAFGMHKVMTGVTDDVNRANAQTGEEVFASWKVAPRLDRWRDVLNSQFLPLFGSTGENVEFDYIYPMPQNREQDNAELTAKTTAAQVLVTAGWDPDDVLEVVGLPPMDFSAPAAAPDAPLPDVGDSGGNTGEGDGQAAMAARLRKVLANGRQPVHLAGV